VSDQHRRTAITIRAGDAGHGAEGHRHEDIDHPLEASPWAADGRPPRVTRSPVRALPAIAQAPPIQGDKPTTTSRATIAPGFPRQALKDEKRVLSSMTEAGEVPCIRPVPENRESR